MPTFEDARKAIKNKDYRTASILLESLPDSEQVRKAKQYVELQQNQARYDDIADTPAGKLYTGIALLQFTLGGVGVALFSVSIFTTEIVWIASGIVTMLTLFWMGAVLSVLIDIANGINGH